QLKLQEQSSQNGSCAICEDIKCNRHGRASLLEDYQPWLGLKIPSKVDASLSEMFELVLENFIYPWYREITDDESPVDELRVTLRFFASVLLRRIYKVNIPTVVTKRMLKAAMKHIEVIAKARQKVKNTEYLQQAALEEYGPSLHVALRSRRDELNYLRKLTELLFSYILLPKATDCGTFTLLIREILSGSVFLPSMDYLADPDTVNHLILIFIDDSPPEIATEPASPLVPFLQKFTESRNKKPSALHFELKEFEGKQDLFFLFMSFLKKEGTVHVLQFYLELEQFNNRILQAELSDSEKMSLHEEVKKIYETYCLDESVDKIKFDPFIVEEIQSIAEGPYEEVVKLQQMRCFFEAYEQVFSLLENVFIPRFCHTHEQFQEVGQVSVLPVSSLENHPESMHRRGESSGIRSISSKIKGVFKSTTMEGAMLPDYLLAEGEDDFIEEGIMVMEDDSPVEALSMPNTPRNLAAWKITIPYVDFFEDPSFEKKERRERIPVFCIDVERNDRLARAFPDAQLPSKRIIGPKNYEFLKSKREEFQEYLQKLSQHPELSNSQLLADFLSRNGGETQFLDKILPDVNLGKKSALYNELYKNNANRSENLERRQNENYFLKMMTVEGVYDYLMYIARVVFHIPDWLHHILMGGRILLKNTLEKYIDNYLQYKLEQLCQEHRLVSLITLLKDAVFCENSQPCSLQDKHKWAKQTFEEMMKYIPDLIGKCIGEDAKYEGIRLLFDGLQQPVLNKQLTYVLLDIGIQELFPELNG
ncbi:Sorting nexin-14, partial [Ophiophagus hannah]